MASSTASASGNSCVEKSDVVGERLCGRYGDHWAKERLFRLVLGTGLWTGHVTPLSRTWHGSFGKENPLKLTLPGRALGVAAIDDVGLDFRIHGYVSRHVYLGFDWALGLGAIKTQIEQQPNLELGQASGLNFLHAKLGGVVGARIPLGPLTARIESVIGLEVASVTATARRPGQSEWVRGSFTSLNLLLEPRIGLDLWTSPWTTVTGWAGMNMVYPSERSMGLSVALHGRPFDGARD